MDPRKRSLGGRPSAIGRAIKAAKSDPTQTKLSFKSFVVNAGGTLNISVSTGVVRDGGGGAGQHNIVSHAVVPAAAVAEAVPVGVDTEVADEAEEMGDNRAELSERRVTSRGAGSHVGRVSPVHRDKVLPVPDGLAGAGHGGGDDSDDDSDDDDEEGEEEDTYAWVPGRTFEHTGLSEQALLRKLESLHIGDVDVDGMATPADAGSSATATLGLGIEDESACSGTGEGPAAVPVKVVLRDKRHKYTPAQIKTILELLDTQFAGKIKTMLKVVNKLSGYEKVAPATVRGWMTPKVAKRLGRRVDPNFEAAVLSRLVFTLASNPSEGCLEERLAVVANVMYNYDVIRTAAKEVQRSASYAGSLVVARLQFSNKWIGKFLERVGFRRRRCTTEDKSSTLPPPAVIQEEMAKIRDVLEENTIPLELRINADETGIKTQESPTHQCVPVRQPGAAAAPRATMAPGNQKLRSTFIIAGTAAGTILPTFSIVRCSIAKPDMSSSTVLKSMLAQPARGAMTVFDDFMAGKWEHKVWRRVMTPPKYAKPTEFIRNYLVHRDTGDIITVQQKAWNDSVGKCPWQCSGTWLLCIWHFAN
jgi:hypothetical protein